MSLRQPAAATGVIERNIGGETVLVPIRTGVADFNSVYILSKVGGFLWGRLDGKRTRDELCELVRQRYQVPPDRDLGADIDLFLGDLDRRGLLVEARP
jgi:hypothetical protein